MRNFYTLLICLALCIANGYLFAFINESFFHLDSVKINGLDNVNTAILAILAAPLLETFLFQMLLYFFLIKMCKLKKDILVILIMSVVFASIHGYNWLYVIAAFFAGIILNSFYVIIYKQNDFLVAFGLTVLLHTLYNMYATFA